ncbi:MAG: DUF3575 domain-containing protein [Acidobacteria bacterium]|nr:DUF3575 domain-containing protein [Acidobacteriota bacterium]
MQFTHENINPPRTSRISALAALLLIAPAALAAQEAAGTKAPVALNQVISSNPLALMFKYGNVEFERKHTGSSTFGLSASSLGFNDATYRNAQVFYRYYPQGAALTSFYIGGRGGVHRVSGEGQSAHAFGFGVELGYAWLLGAQRNFAISLGVGATRLFGGDLKDFSVVFPTVRLINLGWSF